MYSYGPDCCCDEVSPTINQCGAGACYPNENIAFIVQDQGFTEGCDVLIGDYLLCRSGECSWTMGLFYAWSLSWNSGTPGYWELVGPSLTGTGFKYRAARDAVDCVTMAPVVFELYEYFDRACEDYPPLPTTVILQPIPHPTYEWEWSEWFLAGSGRTEQPPIGVDLDNPPWTDPNEISIDNDTGASVLLGTSGTSEYLYAEDFPLAFPENIYANHFQLAIRARSPTPGYSFDLHQPLVTILGEYFMGAGAPVPTPETVTGDWSTFVWDPPFQSTFPYGSILGQPRAAELIENVNVRITAISQFGAAADGVAEIDWVKIRFRLGYCREGYSEWVKYQE